MDKDKKAVWGWAMYDWANSAFATTVMAGFFPIFFKQYWSYGADVNVSTAQLGFGNSIASLLVGLIAPVLGAIADKGSAKKKFLLFFTYLGVLMTAGLFLVHKGQWGVAIFVYVMGIIGFSGANVFYDSLLPSIASEERIDYVSSFGFSLGYLGGGLLFLINVLMTLMPQKFGLPDAAAAVRFSFISVALWWGLFTIFTILWVSEPKTDTQLSSGENAVTAGFRQLTETFKKIRHLKIVLLFLLAYWFYIDGVDTIIRMAVDYGLSLGFKSNDLIVALLLVQFVGFPAALVFGKLGQKWGVRKAIFLAIGIYICITIWGTMMTRKEEFYILAISIGLVQGGIQALSRSYYSRLIPKEKEAEYYGFYNMLGKFAAIIGPALMGIVGLVVRRILMPPSPTGEQLIQVGQLASRWSIASVIVLFIVGAALFYFVDEEKGRKQAKYL
ncbi:MAG: MFS transporter [Deltaproteobacteria bacterium]|nr:MFS transporter [Deltaproteobacteria bacterium]